MMIRATIRNSGKGNTYLHVSGDNGATVCYFLDKSIPRGSLGLNQAEKDLVQGLHRAIRQAPSLGAAIQGVRSPASSHKEFAGVTWAVAHGDEAFGIKNIGPGVFVKRFDGSVIEIEPEMNGAA